ARRYAMKIESRYDTPFVTADPWLSGLSFYEDEPCHDPGTCYPNDDGEADLVDPHPLPVSEGLGFRPVRPESLLASLGDRVVAAFGALLSGWAAQLRSLPQPVSV
ncbi:MAG: hypothetical protein KDD47_23985, partial [Acidobacteria bacterium]|nr:hypothetical protein [Acidobacteriota bacterium]